MYAQRHHFSSNVVPRFQWNTNEGYCGETSFICAGMSFGQYCSQWTARALASPHLPQNHPASQLLLGTGNDLTAATAMRLKASEFQSEDRPTPRALTLWAKQHLLAGHVPIIGVLNNGIALGGTATGEWDTIDGGDPEYDHIVPVLGFSSYWRLEEGDSSIYRPDDVITFSDNGLYGPIGSPEQYPMLYSYEVESFQGVRQQANNPEGAPVYMLLAARPEWYVIRDMEERKDEAKEHTANYGIAIEGVADHDGVCIPVRLTCDQDSEPAMEDHFNAPPTPQPIELTATVELPEPSGAVNLYRYDDFDKVPVKDFNAHPHNAVQVWQIPAGSGQITVTPELDSAVVSRVGSTVVVTLDAMSDQTVVFRAVPASPS